MIVVCVDEIAEMTIARTTIFPQPDPSTSSPRTLKIASSSLNRSSVSRPA